MVSLRYLRDVLEEVESICDAAEESELSVCHLLERMTRILESHLLSAFPSIERYANACDNLIDAVLQNVKILQKIMKDQTNLKETVMLDCHMFIIQEVLTKKRTRAKKVRRGENNLEVSARLRLADDPSHLYIVHRQLDAGRCIWSHLYENINHSEVPIRMIRNKLLTRMSSREAFWCEKSMFGSIGDQSDEPLDEQSAALIQDMYGPMLFSNTVPAFNTQALRREVNDFRTRVELKYNTGRHAADVVLFTPGNDGYVDTAAHYAAL